MAFKIAPQPKETVTIERERRKYLSFTGKYNVVMRQGGVCASVGCMADLMKVTHHFDHITPVEAGGSSTDPNNFQGLCVPCHQRKTRLEAKSRAKIRRITGVTKSKKKLANKIRAAKGKVARAKKELGKLRRVG